MRKFLYLLLAALLTFSLQRAIIPQPAYAVQCDCNNDSDCSSGQECDQSLTGGGIINGDVLSEVCIMPGVCIPTTAEGFAQWALNFGIGLGTLLAIIILIIGGFGVATSGGNPDNLEKAKSQITAAISGLLFILMSVLILDIIGVSILGFDFIK